MKIKAQQVHELVLEQQTAAVAKAQREYDAAAEATKQAHELRVLKKNKTIRECRLNKRNLNKKWLIHLSREADILQ